MGVTVPGAWLISAVAIFVLLLEPVVVLGVVGVVPVVALSAEVVGMEVAMVVVVVVVVVGMGVLVVLEAMVVGVVVEVIETGATGCVSCADVANCWDGRCSGPLGIAFGDDGDGGVVLDRINVCSRTCDWSRSKSFLTGRSLPLLPI